MTHCREEVYLVTIIQCSWMNLNSTDLDKGKGGKIVAHGSGGRQKGGAGGEVETTTSTTTTTSTVVWG